MKLILSVILILSGAAFGQDSLTVFSIADFDSLLTIVKSKGVTGETGGYNEMIFISDSLELKYRMPRNAMEIISVFDQRKKIFYWAVKESGKVSVETKDYTPNVAEKKYREAVEHFREVLKKISGNN
ncbi:MAG TPA: hypothetical protein PKW56_09215 [Clostridiales bacterium]|nr:hypothetical protein [Clostridiales bacterium]